MRAVIGAVSGVIRGCCWCIVRPHLFKNRRDSGYHAFESPSSFWPHSPGCVFPLVGLSELISVNSNVDIGIGLTFLNDCMLDILQKTNS